jgi:hypothetical protein
MGLQHINVKLLVENPRDVDLAPLIPVFHNWIQNQVFEELLLDVADYRHVPEGPGVVLIGHQANYSVDNTANRLGVRYNRKEPLDGSDEQRLEQAARAALTACERLQSDSRLQGKLQFNGRDVELFFNDRLLAPNRDSTRTESESVLRTFLQKLFRGADYSLSYETDPRRLFSVSVKSSQSFSAAELLENLKT